jgi:hypothetical protein
MCVVKIVQIARCKKTNAVQTIAGVIFDTIMSSKSKGEEKRRVVVNECN